MAEYLDKESLKLLKGHYSEIPRHCRAAFMYACSDRDLKTIQNIKNIMHKFSPASDWYAESVNDLEYIFSFRHRLPEEVNNIVKQNKQIEQPIY